MPRCGLRWSSSQLHSLAVSAYLRASTESQKSVFSEFEDFFGFFQLGKVHNFTASFSSSELSAHQMAPSGVVAHSSSSELSAHHMAPSGVIPHWRSPCALEPPSLAQHVLFRYGKETSCRRSSMRRVMRLLATPDTQNARSTWLAQSRQKVPSLSGKCSLYLCCEKVSLAVPRCERVTRRATTQGPISCSRGLTQNSRAGNPKRQLPNCRT